MRVSAPRQSLGFTLVEIMVAMAVLVLILALVGQMTNSAMLSTKLSNMHVDADDEARATFDRMAKDFAGMPHRPDVDFIFAKEWSAAGTTGSNDKMFFYSEAPAFATGTTLYPGPGQPDPKSSVALVGYSVNAGIDNTNDNGANPPPAYSLQRLGRVLTWDASSTGPGIGGLAYLMFSGNATFSPIATTTLLNVLNTPARTPAFTPPLYEGADSSFDLVGPNVFRLEFCFQVKAFNSSGRAGVAYSNYPVAQFAGGSTNKTWPVASTPPIGTNTGQSVVVGDRWYDTQNNRSFICTAVAPNITWVPNGLQDVRAIVVAIAVLDANSRKIISTPQLAKAVSQLQDFPEPGAGVGANPPLMASLWQSALFQANSTFASSTGMPTAAAAQIRVYQRYFYLNNN